MTAPPEVSDEIRKVYADHVAEINKREVSSSENFDRAVLTFSSAGLALSVGFLKDFVPIQSAAAPWTLYWSWVLFTAATCATIISFLVSSQALEAQKGRAYAYYMQANDDALRSGNLWDRGTRVLNYMSAASFLLAMILSVVFISINLEKGSAMKDNNPRNSGGSTEILHKGLTVPTMQQVQRPPAQPARIRVGPEIGPERGRSLRG